jgi:hypothetical protein
LGIYDPTHPGSIAVRATIYDKEVKGYVDENKLWLEPSLDHAESPRYMSLKDGTVVSVVPDPASPAVLSPHHHSVEDRSDFDSAVRGQRDR